MEEHGTCAVAIICGAVSGNLEAIDIDVKNWPGIDARLFEAIREIYPLLWTRLRIHSTPSGGFHILYRTDQPSGVGNLKLATAVGSSLAGIETRGEGGYIVAPPSLGYQVYRDQPIPVITIEQRESLVNLARSFNEKIKIATPVTISKPEMDYYEENPFEAYNHSHCAETVLLDFGWTAGDHNQAYQYYWRPGKSAGISASFNRQTRIYYIFTTSTGLDAERGYHPATLLAILRFGGDKRATYSFLVQQGYGRLRPHIEQGIIKRGEPLPANASAAAKAFHVEQQTKFPHGIYWNTSKAGKTIINREKLYSVASALGYRNYQGQLVLIEGYTVTRTSPRAFYDSLKTYIGEVEEVINVAEAFFQSAGEFSITRIELFDENRLMKSTKTLSYKYFRNGYLGITADSVNFYPYSLLSNHWLVWATDIIPRDYQAAELDQQGLYYQFLSLAIGISTYLWRIIGYLTHDYKDESMAYIILLVDQAANPRDGGGTGKNIFTNLLGHSTTLKNIAGVQAQFNEKFLQAWNFERVLALNDVPKNFNFLFLKEPSSGAAIQKKLYKDDLVISSDQMCKFVVSTNYSYDIADGGLLRRIIPLEFTPFFTLAKGVDTHFGKLFPYDWDAHQWQQYDNIIIGSIQHYLAGGGKLQPGRLSDTGWQKQFDQHYNPYTRQFIEAHIEAWLRLSFVTNDQFNQHYQHYLIKEDLDSRYRLSPARMAEALDDWAERHSIVLLQEQIRRELYDTVRGRVFSKEVAPF